MTDSDGVPEPAPPAPEHPPAHRVALRLLLALGLGGPLSVLVALAVAAVTRSSHLAVNLEEGLIGCVGLGILCVCCEVGAEVTRRLGARRALLLLLPGLLVSLVLMISAIQWAEALWRGRSPAEAAVEIADTLRRLLSFEDMLSRPGLFRALCLLGPPLATLALLRATRARALLLFPLSIATWAATVALSSAAGWSSGMHDAGFLAWPVGAALGLRLVDFVEPRLAARIHRAWHGAREESS